MDEVWERAVETALDGQTDFASARSLTLDGAVKCVQGRLPPPSLLEKFQSLEHLSVANIGVSSLEKFPRLPNLQRLSLSDNRIAGGLEFLVEAGLESLRDLDLSNNRIQYLEDLGPLAQLRLVSLDLYECPVTRIKDYRSRVFGLIKSLKYLDKMDAYENERPESDDEEDEEEDDDEDDPGSGEIDGEDRSGKMSDGGNVGDEGILEVDEDEESDADEEETEASRMANGLNRAPHHHSNGFRDEDYGADYRVRPIGQVEEDAGGSDLDPGYDEDIEEEVEDEDGHGKVQLQPSSSYQLKRKRDNDDSVEDAKSFKHQ
ncbi:hypothetical protein HHK36_010103 [Tetracentron sinense]|uniref:Acidic leucine-rich nuclear phosphoprotein 32-related protein n=1 Tax=Tetracentron sinense TaxID=13715 RepID=A0A834ZHB7_TETSI|nr:hypothetical protein HHK36_010103 [Tetracentron sinense]